MTLTLKLLVTILLITFGSWPVTMKQIDFPDYFEFGSATSSYQIEGGWDADGKGPSIWDSFTHEYPELISDGSNGDIAINSYELYKNDIVALKSIGAQFYRFSISWPRVLSNGDISSKNQAGINYYHKLIDELILNNIKPMVTIFHWDLPQPIQDLGGFTNPNIVNYFEEYANLLFSEYGSKVKIWITLNDQQTFCERGYGEGTWAPGKKLNGVGDYYCAHYSILAHARVYHLYKNNYYEDQGGRIGITLNSNFYFPLNDTNDADKEATERSIEFSFGRYANPIASKSGDYPQVIRDRVEANSKMQGYSKSRLPKFTNDEIVYVRGTADFLGLNYYYSSLISEADDGNTFQIPSVQQDTYVNTYKDPTWPRQGWIYNVPDGLLALLKLIRDKYDNIEVIITENGSSDTEGLEDNFRLSYLQGHLAVVSDAIKLGCNVTAHSTWSLVDNFEWASGYTEKFGIFQVNENFTRVEKKSAGFLRNVIANRNFDLD